MKQNGVSIILLILLFAANSCRVTSTYKSSNLFDYQHYTYYSNDSLRVKIKYFGDYLLSNDISSKDYRSSKAIINSFYPELDLNSGCFVNSGYTTLDPFFKTTLFTVPNNNKIKDTVIVSVLKIPYKTPIGLKVAINNNMILFNVIYFDKKEKLIERYSVFDSEAIAIFKSYLLSKKYYENNLAKDYFGIAKSAFGDSANYLAPISQLSKINRHELSNSDEFMLQQATLTYNSFIQNNSNTISLKSYSKTRDLPQLDSQLDSDALNIITAQSIQSNCIMFNELHWEPKHRALVSLLLDTLYNSGFRYLALEAIWEKGDSLMARKYPIQNTGFYTKESQMANLLRKAVKLGFKIVDYEDMGDEGDREYNQALNLYTKTIKTDPLAKVVVLAGIDHINESESKKKMAYYFKNISGIDPLTINQTTFDAKYNPAFMSKIGIIKTNNKNCDLFILNNLNADYIENSFYQDSIVINSSKTLFLSIFNKIEYNTYQLQAIPIANYIIPTEEYKLDIFTPKGEYIFITRDDLGNIVSIFENITIRTTMFFPLYTQLDAMDCGPTCLRMIAKYYGKTCRLETLRRKSHISREGVSLLGISEAAENIGFKSLGVRLSFEELIDAPLPCIVHWGQEHFVVVYKIQQKRNETYVYVADPAGGLVKYTKQEFIQKWISTQKDNKDRGIALLLETTPDFYAS